MDKPEFQPNMDRIHIRLANSRKEVEAAQRLRFKVFYEECAAVASAAMAAVRRDFDQYDDVADHLIVIDDSIADENDRIVGTYRLIRREIADKIGHFYTSDEYDILPILNSGTTLLELGRSCVLAEYRTRPVLQLLWKGIADYITRYNIGLLFGCASLHGTDVSSLSQSLAYLYHYHLAPEDLRPRALDTRYVNMNLHTKDLINPKVAFNALPPLIKGYLRLGATIGDGAVVDTQFNTTDVCIVLQTALLTSRYRKHYERSTQKPLNAGADPDTSTEGLEVPLGGLAMPS